MRWMAVDHGTRRIGIAFCDAGETIATPHAVWPNDAASTARLAALARDEEAGAVVVGLPRHDDGAESGTAGAVRTLAAILSAALSQEGEPRVPVVLWDEGHSSREADRRLDDAGFRGDRRMKRDAVAAAVILEDLIATRRQRGIALDDADCGPAATARQ